MQELFSLSKDHNLKVQLANSFDKIKEIPDIIIINSFGDIAKYFYYCKSVFIGKSLPEKFSSVGGQNPIEPAKFGCKIYHGPHVSNFKEIYEHLQKKKISFKVKNQNHLTDLLQKKLDKKNFSKISMKNLSLEGIKILNKIFNEIC